MTIQNLHFTRKRIKKVEESSSSFKYDKYSTFKKTSKKREEGYEIGTKYDSEEDNPNEGRQLGNIMGNITTMTIEEYKRHIRDDIGPSIVIPEVPTIMTFP